ncbi:MAG: hypothetical protein JJT77_05845 [Crocinitomicaceae bacterium]|nr:hypothetical protein [Crocinitomicaceae bacterium]
MMRLLIFAISFSGIVQVFAQDVFPFIDNIGYMRSFQDGKVVQIEYIPPKHVEFSEKIIAFVDHKNDFFVFDGEKKELLSNLATRFQLGYHLVAWNAGPLVNVWDRGKKRTLTQFGRNYVVTDSLVVFEDLMENAIMVYYNDSVYTLVRSVDIPRFPLAVGTNSVAFIDNGDVHKAFVAGKILEIGVINDPVRYKAGGNKVAFNDPFHQSFAVVHQKEIVDVEEIMITDYQVGWDIVVYRDLNKQLFCYQDYKVSEISNFNARSFEVFRDMVVWNEAGLLFCYYKGKRYEIANFIPEEYKIRDGIVAFRNLNGGVSVFDKGEVRIISNLKNAPFEVNGSTVRVQVNRGNFVFYKDGETYNH